METVFPSTFLLIVLFVYNTLQGVVEKLGELPQILNRISIVLDQSVNQCNNKINHHTSVMDRINEHMMHT